MKKHIIEVPDVEAVGVYAIHNKKNDKYYIGSSVNVKTRLKTHQRNMEKLQGSNLKMDEDLKTFEDLENFEFIVLKTFFDSLLSVKLLQMLRSLQSLYRRFTLHQ